MRWGSNGIRGSILEYKLHKNFLMKPIFYGVVFKLWFLMEDAYLFLVIRPVVLVVDSVLSNCFLLLRKDNEDKLQACFIAIVINCCSFKVNLFTHLDNIFPCSLINQLIKLMFL